MALAKAQENILRRQIAVSQETIKECNEMLVAGGCEPEPDTLVKGAKVVASGIIARTGSFFGSIGKGVKEGYANTKAAGEQRIASKEVDKQVEEQMKAVKEQLHKALGA